MEETRPHRENCASTVRSAGMAPRRARLAAALAVGVRGVACRFALRAARPRHLTPRRDTIPVNRSANPLLSSFRFRSIGPASMGGRVDDIAVAPTNHSIIYVGYATGGVFRSVNAGTTFEPVFERYGSASIGALAIDPTNPDVVYVGTGEPNNRQTSTFGDGIYKSTDGGKTFTNIGLTETQTIARIVIDPKHPDVVYVAVPGHLFGPSPDRGVYKTTDGGKTWNKIKYIDENTGFTDIAMDPKDPNTLYAASYQRRRSGCCFNGGGPGSALWKTDNGGKSWTKLTGNGLPPGTYGRIALDVSRSNPNVVYAQIETDGGATTPAVAAGGAGGGGGRGGYDWCNNGAPRAANDTTKPPALERRAKRHLPLGEQGALVDRGEQLQRPSALLQPDPRRPDERPAHLRRRRAHGEVGRRGAGPSSYLDLEPGSGNQGEDQHAFWIDPSNPDHILRGTDAGFMVTWDQGATWEYVRTMATSLAYWVTRGHGASVQRLLRPAGQRQLGRAERDAQPRRHPESRVVPVSAAATDSRPR